MSWFRHFRPKHPPFPPYSPAPKPVPEKKDDNK